jgi:hypothetical protein
VAVPLRGAWTGNRGILHRGTEIVRFHAHEHWIVCALRFKDRWHERWEPHHFTWLYFHDEAVAFAAGHRPCAECRRADYKAYRAAWADGLATELPSAKAIDRRLHGERIVRGTHRRVTYPVPWTELPEGAFVLFEQRFAVLVAGALTTWSPAGYGDRLRRPLRGTATVLTPPATLAALRSGYPVQIDDSARG